VNVGTRFLASVEAGASEAWKQLIVGAESEDTVRFDTWSSIMPASGYEAVPRVIRTDFVARWESQTGEAIEQAEQLRAEILGSIQQGRQHEVTPFTGQIAGLIHELLPADEIVRGMVGEAERALAGAAP
jgi:nitronate monooxygenase/enoyl-[acyl-carrier protein] reductase II